MTTAGTGLTLARPRFQAIVSWAELHDTVQYQILYSTRRHYINVGTRFVVRCAEKAIAWIGSALNFVAHSLHARRLHPRHTHGGLGDPVRHRRRLLSVCAN